MGDEVEAKVFSREDRQRYREKVKRNLDVFARMLRESRFDAEKRSIGLEIETLLLVPVLDAAPPVEAIGVAARSMSQQSHIRIDAGHYRRAVEALASVAAER